MTWAAYWGVLRRRWLVVLLVIVMDLVAAGALLLKDRHSAGYQACTTLYVADVSAPSTISAPPTTLETAGQLLAGETAANFFADDVLDVAQSRDVARYVSRQLASKGLPHGARGDVLGAISGSRRDRTVDLCVVNPASQTALAAAGAVGSAMSSGRAQFLGRQIARRTYVAVVSQPSVGRVAAGHALLNFGLRVALGVLLALGLAALWDAADPRVRDARDLERCLDVPVAVIS